MRFCNKCKICESKTCKGKKEIYFWTNFNSKDRVRYISWSKRTLHNTGKSLSEVLIFAEHGRTCCVHKFFWMSKTISVHNMFSPCSELGIFMYWTCNSMNNLSSYYVLVDAQIRASDKNLPATTSEPNYKEKNTDKSWTKIRPVLESFWT